MPKVIFPQYVSGREGIDVRIGATLMDHARELRIPVASACGGHGLCGKCVVRIDRGLSSLAPKTSVELAYDLARDERLACQARVISGSQDIDVYVKAAGEFTILTESIEGSVPLDPIVHRQGDQVVLEGMRTRSLGTYEGELLGVAVDVGTTTMVAQLLDLESGRVLTTVACKNPQAAYGDDVISASAIRSSTRTASLASRAPLWTHSTRCWPTPNATVNPPSPTMSTRSSW